MLEKYLNKEVIIEEKLYQYASTISNEGMAKMTLACQNRISGVVTAIDNNFIELDNNSMINLNYIYRIRLK